jgi:H+-transporting ATPase
MDILCSDKTGTLTQNKLKLGEPMLLKAEDEHALLLVASLASKAEDQDAIDLAVLAGLEREDELKEYRQVKFMPFDPVAKRTEATVEGGEGNSFKVSKGAPQVIMDLCKLDPGDRDKAQAAVDEFATKGFRTLGVARSDAGEKWTFLGVLPLFDPPREDSADTIRDAEEHGVNVKMVTGDNLAIAREISGKLNLGKNILVATELFDEKNAALDENTAEQVERSDGFAQVFPEHKFNIVKALQSRGHIVGMTGDGVNDAPALKQAEVGIAVSGATDAARAAADLVLTAPGLSVIVSAIEEARRIFERMNSYAIYRITETIRIMVFVVLAMLVFNFYPITAIMIILLAFFNDIPIMTIAYDNTSLDPQPVRWEMHRVILVSTVMGLTGVSGSFLMLYVAVDFLHLTIPEVQSFVFLKMAVAGHLTLFISRSKGFFLKKPYPAQVMIWSAVGTKVAATFLVAYGFGLVTPIGWGPIGLIWLYSITWALVTDWAKLIVYGHYEYTSRRHVGFLQRIHQPSSSHSAATTLKVAQRDTEGRRKSE